MKKTLLIVLLSVATLVAGTVGGTKDGKLWDRAFLDINIGDVVNYQYAQYYGQGFKLKSRSSNKAFALYNQRKINVAHVQVSGRIAIPKELGDSIKLYVKGSPSYGWCNNKYNRNKAGYNFCSSMQRGYNGVAHQLFINGKRVTQTRSKHNVSTDALGNRFLSFRIEGFAYRGNFNDNLKNMIDNISALSFAAEVHAKQKRGADLEITKMPLRVYVIEE